MVLMAFKLADSGLGCLEDYHKVTMGSTEPNARLEAIYKEKRLQQLVVALHEIEKVCTSPRFIKDPDLGSVRRTIRVGRVLKAETCFFQAQICLTRERLSKVIAASETSDQEVLKFISCMYADGFLDFPWKKYFLKPPSEMFLNLRRYEPCVDHTQRSHSNGRLKSGQFLSINKFDDVPTSVVVRLSDYEDMDVIVDHFQEECRLSATRSDQPKSPLDMWKDSSIVLRILTRVYNQGHPISTYHVRETLYLEIKECTQFKPSFVVAVGKLLGGVSRVLDFSAGWGDRLAGFLALGVKRYAAFDPNTKLKTGHEAIRQTLSPYQSDTTQVTIDYSPFEDAQLPPGETFDLIFTSPPFFTFEKYEGENTSTTRYPEFERWAVEFFFLALHKAWSVLDAGGHLCIYIQDSRGVVITEAMCLFILAALPGSVSRGVIYSLSAEVSGQPRPLWVFKREQHSDLNRKEEALELLQTHFANLFGRIRAHPVLRDCVGTEDERLKARVKGLLNEGLLTEHDNTNMNYGVDMNKLCEVFGLCRRRRESSIIVALWSLPELREEISTHSSSDSVVRRHLSSIFHKISKATQRTASSEFELGNSPSLKPAHITKLRLLLDISHQDDIEMRLARLLSSDSDFEKFFSVTWNHSVRCTENHVCSHLHPETYCRLSKSSEEHQSDFDENEQSVSLFSYLSSIFRAELLDQDNQFHCSKCRTHRAAISMRFIQRASKCMVIYIPRAVYSTDSHMWMKRRTKITFPLRLHGPFGEYDLHSFICNDTDSYWTDTVKSITFKHQDCWWRLRDVATRLTESQLEDEITENPEVLFLFYVPHSALPSLKELTKRCIFAEHIKQNTDFSLSILEESLSRDIMQEILLDYQI